MSTSSENLLSANPPVAALEEAAGEIRHLGLCRWSFPAGPEETVNITAKVDPDWVFVDAPLTACEGTGLQPKRLWNLLHANAGLSGGAKFAVGGAPRSVRVRAEVPVHEGIDPAPRIRNACRGFQEALLCFRHEKSGRSADGSEPLRPAELGPSDGRLQGLCTEAGWVFSGCPDGGIAVRLEVPEAYYQASVRSGKRGSISVWVELASEGAWPRDSWKALGVFLLQACGHLKTVRAAARNPDPGGTTAGFEVVLEPSAGSEELGRAFRALSVACTLVGQEVRVLGEETVGKEYLAMVRGWSSRSGQSNTNQAQKDCGLHRAAFCRAYNLALVLGDTPCTGLNYGLFGWRCGGIHRRGFRVLHARRTGV